MSILTKMVHHRNSSILHNAQNTAPKENKSKHTSLVYKFINADSDFSTNRTQFCVGSYSCGDHLEQNILWVLTEFPPNEYPHGN